MKHLPMKMADAVVSKIIQKRTEKGYTLETIADELKISTAAYYKIEKRETKLSLTRLFQIQQILEITIGDLFEIPKQEAQNTNETLKQIEDMFKEKFKVTSDYITSLKAEIAFLREQINENKNSTQPPLQKKG
jgi:transcriptional regulator with XRE-family HTH domain